MERIESPDGSIEVEIEAEVGDTLYIQVKHDNLLSRDEQHKVPEHTEPAVDAGIDAATDTDSGTDADSGTDET